MAGGNGGDSILGKPGYGGPVGQPGQSGQDYSGGGGGGAGGFAGGTGGASGGGAGGAGGDNGGYGANGGNAAPVTGGAGIAGTGGASKVNGGGGGGGGSGGRGLVVGTGSLSADRFLNSGAATGGGGGDGGDGGAGSGTAAGNRAGSGGGGGDAGTALAFTATGAQLDNSGTLRGGTAGKGGNGGASSNASAGGTGGAGGYGGTGLSVASGDTVTNSKTAKIYGGDGGAGGAAGSSGVAPGAGGYGGSGVFARDGGVTFVNQDSAKIVGGASGNGFVGPHARRGGYGVYLGGAGNSFTNQGSASITGGRGGDGVGSITNGDTVYAAGGDGGAGVRFSGTTFRNLGKATITGGAGGAGAMGFDINQQTNVGGDGGAGVYVTYITGAKTTLINEGSITGGNGGSGAGMYSKGGAGIVGGNLTVINTGSISRGTGSGQTPLSIDAITFTGGANVIAFGTSATFGGPLDIQSGGSLTFNQGAGTGLPADATLSTFIRGNGSVIKVGTGVLKLTGLSSYQGGTTISGGTLDLAAASSSLSSAAGRNVSAITFDASNGGVELDLESGAQIVGGTFTNTLTNFNTTGETLYLKGFAFGGTTSYMTSGNTLTVTNMGGETETFRLSNGATTYRARSDNNGGTLIDIACFASGTRIRTARGDIAVERLRVGDLVVTACGARRPIRWLGHRTIDCRGHARQDKVWPIRIAADAFGDARPARDLLVSPGHAVCVDVLGEVLVPAHALVNGSTVRQLAVDTITYWHVELDSHDILLAENLPTESYLEMGNRGFFQNCGVVTLAGGPDGDGARRTTADYCRPFLAGGVLVEVVRRQLCLRAERLGWPFAEPCPPPTRQAS